MEDAGIPNAPTRSATCKGMIIGAWVGVILTIGAVAIGLALSVSDESFLYIAMLPVAVAMLPAVLLCKLFGYELALCGNHFTTAFLKPVILAILTNALLFSIAGATIGRLAGKFRRAP